MNTCRALTVCIVASIALAASANAEETRKSDVRVARVNGVPITRDEIRGLRCILAMTKPGSALDDRHLLDYAIRRALWEPYFEREKLWPSDAEIKRAIQELDTRRGQRRMAYFSWLNAHHVTAEEQLREIRFELAMQRLEARLRAQLQPGEIQAEFAGRPEWYDGSRIRISGIFVDTRSIADSHEQLREAKERIEKLHEQLLKGANFDLIAQDYSEAGANSPSHDIGWFFRSGEPVVEPEPPLYGVFGAAMPPAPDAEVPKMPPGGELWRAVSGTRPERKAPAKPVEEALIAAAWGLKVGEFTKPIQTARGWHILKVTAREGAYLTFFGAKEAVGNALVRRRTEAILGKLRAAAKIEVYLDSQ